MLKIKLWGTRGSIPTPDLPQTAEKRTRALMEKFLDQGNTQKSQIDQFFKSLPKHQVSGWGGNTACIEVKTENTRIIIDGGSGIRNIEAGKGEFHIFFTHFHWDHIIGLPFFVPFYIPGNKIHLYAVQKDLPDMMKNLFKKPYFPVPLEGLAASIEYHELKPREKFKLGDVEITPYQLDHPDPCWGYRFEHGGKSFAYCVDTEATRISRLLLGVDLPMYQDLDFMVFDSQYTLEEAIKKMNWGHAAATIGLDLAIREKIKRVAFVHHDPIASDEKIAHGESLAREYYESQLKLMKQSGVAPVDVEWAFAREGDEFIL